VFQRTQRSECGIIHAPSAVKRRPYLPTDNNYVFIGILDRIPKANLDKIEWTGRKPELPDGDALLITRTPNDLSSGLVMYLSDGQLVSGAPKNYQTIDLSE
jgi:hypothetical protein